MITVNIRKQGGAAVMTIPANILKMLNLEIGSALELDVTAEAFTAHPIHKNTRKRYSLAELLKGTSSQKIANLNKKTAWAHEGKPVGRELA